MNYAIILSMAAGSYRELKEYEKAYDYLKQAYTTIATINKGEENLACGMILNSMGMLFKRWRKFDRALDSYERSLNIRLEFLGDKHPEVIASRHNIGELYIEMGNTEKAEEYLT
jgi:tetratricopeptide (TPR) repeat protein